MLVFAHSRNADVADWGLELDQRVSAVVLVARRCFAICAEVHIIADGALVADTLDVGRSSLVLAKRAIAVDAVVALVGDARLGYRLIDGHEAVHGVVEASTLDALGAVIPVRAVQALVTHTVDVLVAAIAKSGMTDVTASSAEEVRKRSNLGLRGSGLEGVGRMVTMLGSNVAGQAKIEVVASYASDKLALWEDYTTCQQSPWNWCEKQRTLDAGVAGPSWKIFLLFSLLLSLLLIHVCTRHLLSLHGLGANALGSAVDDFTATDKPLDEPVVLARAMHADSDARLAKVVVSIVADGAVIVGVRHRFVAGVAVYGPGARRGLGGSVLHTEGELASARDVGELGEEV